MYKFAMLLAAAGLSGTALANERPSTPVGSSVAGQPVLPANTELTVRLNEELTSKRARKGQRFAVSVTHDVLADGRVVIPRGTPGSGEVTWRTGRGAFGKSGKMEIRVQELRIGDRVVPVSGQARVEGDGNTGAMIGTVLLAGPVAGAFVTGASAVFRQGHEIRAFTTAALPVDLAATPTAYVAPLMVAGPPVPMTVAATPAPAPIAAVGPVPMPIADVKPARVPTIAATPAPVTIVASAAAPAYTVAPAPVVVAVSVPASAPTLVMHAPAARQTAAEIVARRLAAAEPVRGRDAKQGWTISD